MLRHYAVPFRAHSGMWPWQANFSGYPPSSVAAFYGFPQMPASTPMPTTYIIELGGGFSAPAMQAWCAANGYPMPNLTALSVDGATNAYTGDPNSADGEVVLDICVQIGALFQMYGARPANIVVLFAPNTDTGFLHAVQYVASKGNCTGSISWGGPEDQWSAASILAMDAAFRAGTDNGVIWCCAAGDSGPSDGESGLHVDYPGSSPYVVCCGGTTIATSGGKITSEVFWNSNGATGDGFSAVESAPAYQSGFNTSNFRSVPDVAANADPASGYATALGVFGGTSAVAPLMAAFFAAVQAQAAVDHVTIPGMINVDLYANRAPFNALVPPKGFPANCLGSPQGGLLFKALLATAPPPPVNPPPTVPPPVTPPAAVTKTESQVAAAVMTGLVLTQREIWRGYDGVLTVAAKNIGKALDALYSPTPAKVKAATLTDIEEALLELQQQPWFQNAECGATRYVAKLVADWGNAPWLPGVIDSIIDDLQGEKTATAADAMVAHAEHLQWLERSKSCE